MVSKPVIESEWDTLRQMRNAGHKPALPVFICSYPRFAKNLTDCGAFVIVHPPSRPMPVELLEGLDVRLHFLNCDMGGRVKRLMDAKDVKPKSLQVWCNCGETYTVSCGPCDDGSEPWAA
jgi:hypothetical protein